MSHLRYTVIPQYDLAAMDTAFEPLDAIADAEVPAIPSPTPPLPSRRARALPGRYRDFLPTGVSRVVTQISENAERVPPRAPPPRSRTPPPEPVAQPPTTSASHAPKKWTTAVNKFGIFREYLSSSPPSYIPDEDPLLEDLLLPTAEPPPPSRPPSPIESKLLDAVDPFPNLTSFWFRKHFADFTTNSKAVAAKCRNMLLHPRFRNSDLLEYNMERTDRELVAGDSLRPANGLPPSKSGQWIQADVPIQIPLGKDAGGPSERNLNVNVKGLHYRKLYDVIRTSMANEELAKKMHVEPYRCLWQKPDSPPNQFQRIFDEVYTSDAFIQEHEKLQGSPSEPDCSREKVILSMMFASDATHPTNFGQAKLWPLYLTYGNISKYERCKPTSSVMEHVAFLPSVSNPAD